MGDAKKSWNLLFCTGSYLVSGEMKLSINQTIRRFLHFSEGDRKRSLDRFILHASICHFRLQEENCLSLVEAIVLIALNRTWLPSMGMQSASSHAWSTPGNFIYRFKVHDHEHRGVSGDSYTHEDLMCDLGDEIGPDTPSLDVLLCVITQSHTRVYTPSARDKLLLPTLV